MRQMIKKRLCTFMILIMISICTIGCSLDEYVEMGYYLIESEATDKDEDKFVALTEEEKTLLVYIEGESSKERIEKGEIGGVELYDLEHIRGMKNSLKQKYPSYDIKITRCSPPTQLTVQGNKYRFELEYDDESYSAEISFDNEEKPIYRDDFFDYILRSKYDPRITKLLHDNGFDIHSYTYVGAGLSEDDVNENTSIDEYRVLCPSFEPRTYIYIEKEEDRAIAEAIWNILIKEEISDVYFLMFVGDNKDVKYEDIHENRWYHPYYMFEKNDNELKRYDEESKSYYEERRNHKNVEQ